MIHSLKIWPQYFKEIIDGEKTFEYREDDRGYSEGDIIILNEYFPTTKTYSGKSTYHRAGYILRVNGYAIISLLKLTEAQKSHIYKLSIAPK